MINSIKFEQSQSNNEDRAYFRERVIFFSNCYVLCNYNPTGKGSYRNHQIKADPSDKSLHFTSTVSVERAFSWALSYVSEPPTKLDKTLVIIEKVVKKIIDEALALESILPKNKQHYENVFNRFNAVYHVALQVFTGIITMYNTYQKHYVKDKYVHNGLTELYELTEKLNDSYKILKDKYKKYHNIFKQLEIKDVNKFLCNEMIYYDNLYALSKYGTTEHPKYKELQIKAIDDSDRLISTSFWGAANWTGILTPLKKTVRIINKVCLQLQDDCEPIVELFKRKSSPLIEDDMYYKLNLALPGVIKMDQAYQKHYKDKKMPNHEGLSKLSECTNSLSWAETSKFYLNTYSTRKNKHS